MIDIDLELDLARNMFGSLDAEIREILMAVVEKPSQRTWNDAHGIIVGSDGSMTLWQAVMTVSPSFPNYGRVTGPHGRIIKPWPEIPSSAILIQARGYATH